MDILCQVFFSVAGKKKPYHDDTNLLTFEAAQDYSRREHFKILGIDVRGTSHA